MISRSIIKERAHCILQTARRTFLWLALWLLSKLYGLVTRLRNLFYDIDLLPIHSISLPVVCVGNLMAGGSGKTPLVLTLARELIARGHQPVILSRGYGGSVKGPYRVCPEDSAESVGDEPLLIARQRICPIVIARDRVAGGRFIHDSRLASVILLDDGFQHRRLHRICNIATFFVGSDAAVEAIVEGALLPVGRFREDRQAGLSRADLVALCERGGRSAEESVERIRGLVPATIPTFLIRSSVAQPRQQGRVLEAGSSVWLFCAIANPEGFLESVRQMGYSVQGESCFSDHHRFTQKECEELGRHAHSSGAALVCTEKDWVKLEPPLRDEVWVVGLEAEVPVAMVDLIERKICGDDSSA